MLKTKYKLQPVSHAKRKTSMTKPDQSMSILEIVRRFTRGLPSDVVQRQPVYVDQQEHDLEKLSRLDFADKAQLAQDIKSEAERAATSMHERSEARKERARNAQDKQSGAKSGINPLDDTMPDDTSLKTK